MQTTLYGGMKMVKIVDMQPLNPTLTKITLEAPHIAKKVKTGQFGILRVTEDGERFPLTIEDWDVEKGTICFIFQVAGASTELLNHKKPGESSPMWSALWATPPTWTKPRPCVWSLAVPAAPSVSPSFGNCTTGA